MEKIPDIIDPSWHQFLQPLFDDKKMQLLKYDILANCEFYPEPSHIFRVFSMPIDKIKVVILGQDPYPNGQATGLAFAIDKNTKVPASLKIIKEEVYKSHAVQHSSIYYSKWYELGHWFGQGVFLLNTALTVRKESAGSHLKYWEWFTREVIRVISVTTKPKPIWLLWGAKAQSFRDYINNYCRYVPDTEQSVLAKCNYGLEAAHPAKETYPDHKPPIFSGCNHFNIVNNILREREYSVLNNNIIEW